MKKLLLLIFLMSIAASLNQLYAQKKATKIVCFKSNMDCSQCENTLTEHLKFLRGVKDLNVNHVANTIYIEYKEGKNSEEKFAKAIEKKGYKAEKVTIEEYRQIIQKAAEKGHEHGAEVHTVRKKQQVQK